jgi:hypothetical protein
MLDHGTLERVCPLNITIWPNRDEVLLRQEYHHREETTHHELTVNAEDIMWAVAISSMGGGSKRPIAPNCS